MRTVKSARELKKWVKAGETEFYVDNPRLYKALVRLSERQKKDAQKSVTNPEGMTPYGGAQIATPVAIAAIVGATLILLYAIYKDYDIDIKGKDDGDKTSGRVIITRKKK